MTKFDLKTSSGGTKVIYVGAKDRKYQFWKRNSMTKYLHSKAMIEQKLEYIHNNIHWQDFMKGKKTSLVFFE